jgi:hypothetical protein
LKSILSFPFITPTPTPDTEHNKTYNGIYTILLHDREEKVGGSKIDIDININIIS